MELSVSAERTVPVTRWLDWHAIVVFGFLYLPIVTLIVYSFNGSGVGGFPPRDLTLNWYRLLAADEVARQRAQRSDLQDNRSTAA